VPLRPTCTYLLTINPTPLTWANKAQHPDNTLLHPGFAALSDKSYILRPEAIESILILYRVTGDENLRDHAWTMFQAIEHHTATRYGNTALNEYVRSHLAPVVTFPSLNSIILPGFADAKF
jgi:mannosyl-oligosaccharide alpha-1,2-mannosidase